jgi:phosphate transport system permease protein
MRGAPFLLGSFLLFGSGLLVAEAWPFVAHILGSPDLVSLESLVRTAWYPEEGDYGLLAIVVGSLAVVALALVLALPVSFFSALSLVFFLPRGISRILRLLLEVFAGVPSVVLGLFGLMTLVPWFALFGGSGFGLASASVVLAILLLPHTCVQICGVLEAESKDLLLTTSSLGFSRSRAIWILLLPSRWIALVQSALLAASRGLGETLAVVMVAGNIVHIPSGLFEPFRTLNATIALEIAYAEGPHRGALFLIGLLTLFLVWSLRFIALGLERIRCSTNMAPGES